MYLFATLGTDGLGFGFLLTRFISQVKKNLSIVECLPISSIVHSKLLGSSFSNAFDNVLIVGYLNLLSIEVIFIPNQKIQVYVAAER